MSRPKKAPEPDKFKACDRCGDHYPTNAIWPDGRICQYCYRAAHRTRGICATCTHEGILPGRDEEGRPTCRSCSGVRINIDCVACGAEDELYAAGKCWRCYLDNEITVALGERVDEPEYAKFKAALVSAPRANSTLTWIRQPHVRDVFKHLRESSDRLTHETLDALPSNRTREFIRELLEEAGALSPTSRYLRRFDEWIVPRMARARAAGHGEVFALFIAWHQRRRLESGGTVASTDTGLFLSVKQTTTVALEFLEHLHQIGQPLDALGQNDVDDWLAAGSSTRRFVSHFLYWARKARHIPHLEVREHARSLPESDLQLSAVLSRVLRDESTPLGYRVATGFLALYGQSLSAVSQMRTDQISVDESGEMTVLFAGASHEVPVPLAFAMLVDTWMSARENMKTAANQASTWLFPGQAPGRSLLPGTLSEVLGKHGLNPRPLRAAALLDIVRHTPAPIVAAAFGFAPHSVDRYEQASGARYARYAALRTT